MPLSDDLRSCEELHSKGRLTDQEFAAAKSAAIANATASGSPTVVVPAQAVSPTPAAPDLEARIKELGDKSTQILLFLSFSFVAVITFKADHGISKLQQNALTVALRWWVVALCPVMLGIVPLKEFVKYNVGHYSRICKFKAGVLWIAIVFIFIGAVYFGMGIWPTTAVKPDAAPVSEVLFRTRAMKSTDRIESNRLERTFGK